MIRRQADKARSLSCGRATLAVLVLLIASCGGSPGETPGASALSTVAQASDSSSGAAPIGSTSPSVSAPASIPAAGPTVQNPGSQPSATQKAVNVSWSPSPEPDVLGYRVYFGTQSRSYMQERGAGIDAGLVPSYTVSGLTSGTRYYFAVTAFDQSGNESEYSLEIEKVIQ